MEPEIVLLGNGCEGWDGIVGTEDRGASCGVEIKGSFTGFF